MTRIPVSGVSLLLLVLVIAGCTGRPKLPAEPTPTAKVDVPAKAKAGVPAGTVARSSPKDTPFLGAAPRSVRRPPASSYRRR